MEKRTMVVLCGAGKNAAGLVVEEGTALFERLNKKEEDTRIEVEEKCVPRLAELNFRDKMLKKRMENLYSKYSEPFNAVKEFEDTLLSRFEAKIEESPLKEQFTENLKLEIPFTKDEERILIESYLKSITSKAKEYWAQEGIEFNMDSSIAKDFNNDTKSTYKITLSYKLDVAVNLSAIFE